MIFLDTSVIYALANTRDPNHSHAVSLYRRALENGEVILIHNYVLAEAAALLQHRIGLVSALRFLRQAQDFQVHWITAEDHWSAVDLLEDRDKRGLSLVDCASFVVAHQYGVQEVLAFDPDFTREGFTLYSRVDG